MYVIGITEIQFISCLQLIRNRLKLINEQLNNNMQPILTSKPNNNNNGKNIFNCNYYGEKKINLPENGTFARRAINIMNNNDTNCMKSIFIIRTLNEKAMKNSTIIPIEFESPGTYLNHDDDKSSEIIQFHQIYTKLECVMTVVNAAFSLHLIIILITKFTTLTSLLYFCSMVIIR